MVCTWVMANSLHRAAHSCDVNCGPLSLVMVAGTPNRWILPCRSAAAQSPAVTVERGMASAHLVVLSTIVNRYEKPEESGSGPTKSIWRCAKRRAGTGMCAA